MNKVIIGTELKLNINIQPIDGLTMTDYDFEVMLISGIIAAKSKTYSKNELVKDDDNNYILPFNTQDVGLGKIVCRIIAHLPDGAFSDRKRTEIVDIDTGIEVVKGIM